MLCVHVCTLVCVCVCMHVCMCVCMCVCVCVCMDTREQVVAVTKEFKRGRNFEFFLHNEYLALARLGALPSCPPGVLGVFIFSF